MRQAKRGPTMPAGQPLCTQMKITEEFPTIFARTFGEKAGLLLPMTRGIDPMKRTELLERMQYFQQMAVTSRFEDCVIAYYGMKLTNDQIDVLKIIHQSTKPWITGHIVGVLMERINSSKVANKDIAESVRVLVEQAQEKETGKISGRMQGILVKSTQSELNQKQRKLA